MTFPEVPRYTRVKGRFKNLRKVLAFLGGVAYN